MKPKRIILIRHGESEGNIDKGIIERKPDYALELSPKGIDQAVKAGKELKSILGEGSVHFYLSPFWRARMTLEQILPNFDRSKIRISEEPRLREQEWGHLRNEKETAEIEKQRDAYGSFYFRFPDGESGADVYDRVSDVFGTLYRDFNKPNFQENAVMVTHGTTIRLFLMRWFHWTVEQFEEYSNPYNCQIITLERKSNEKYELISELKKHEVKHHYQRPLNWIIPKL